MESAPDCTPAAPSSVSFQFCFTCSIHPDDGENGVSLLYYRLLQLRLYFHNDSLDGSADAHIKLR